MYDHLSLMFEIAAARVHSMWSTRMAKIRLLGVAMCCVAAAGALIGFGFQAHSRVTRTRLPALVPHSEPASPSSLIAALVTTTTAYRWPGGPATSPIAPSWHGSPLFLPVIAKLGGDLEVRLPTRPNGSTAWIHGAGVRLYKTDYRIVVDLGTRHLLLYRSGKLILDAPAGIGTVNDPTPVGHFFVASFATAPSPEWGPFVLVTSAHSNAISDWEQSGDAIVAIHGPLGEGAAIGSQGARISHGCVRLQDANLAQLRGVPDGSPVDIIA